MSMEHRKLLARHRLIDSALNVTVAAINALLLITGKACINQAIHVLFDARLLYFTYTHSWPSQKLRSSTVTCLEMNVI